MRVFDYSTHPSSGAVHVLPTFTDRTLCGLSWEPEWIDGDETVTGLASTCATCRAGFGLAPLVTA